MEAPGLFTPIRVGTLNLPNRIIMSPAFTNSALPDGQVSDQTIRHYVARARSGVGLVMTEHTSVNSYFIHGGLRLRVSEDKFIPRLALLADEVHKTGGKIGLQIAHSIYGAGMRPEDLTHEQCEQIVVDFVQGARRAKEAGFDVVELHCAHTYTLADFLSRRTNKRWDDFGGDVYGRFRIVRDICLGIRNVVGRDYPFWARMDADEFIISGNTLTQGRVIAVELEKCGVDCIDVTAGVRFDDGGAKGYSDIRGKPMTEYPDGPNVYLAEDIKKYVKVPVVTVGKLGTPAFAESVIREGRADLVAMARPLIADPLWVKKVHDGRTELLQKCVYCTSCLWKRRKDSDAVRCMERDCSKCLTCLRICPYKIPRINADGKLEFDRDWCDECGLCAGICPASVVRFQANPQADWVKDTVVPAMNKMSGSPRMLIVTCSYGPFASERNTRIALNHCGAQAAAVRVPCVGKLQTVQMLRALEQGLDAIVVAGCDDPGQCKHRPAYQWAPKRVARAQEQLQEAGLAGQVDFVPVKAGEAAQLPRVMRNYLDDLTAEQVKAGG